MTKTKLTPALFFTLCVLIACSSAPTFSSVAAKVPELVQCPEADSGRAKQLIARWRADRETVEQELIDQIKSGPGGAAIAVCQIRDVYTLGQEVGEAFTRAKEALEELKALPNP
jgi:hypothetical protein